MVGQASPGIAGQKADGVMDGQDSQKSVSACAWGSIWLNEYEPLTALSTGWLLLAGGRC